MMDILINSLYTNRDIFLREQISNSADAQDKIRYLSLVNSTYKVDDLDDLDIYIRANSSDHTLTITDKGIGMTKEEQVKNLGIVAKSGTSEFLKAATNSTNDPQLLIGQFGVGFYSVYLVADRVTVASKTVDGEQYIWESSANGTFTVAHDPRGNTQKHGTEVVLYMKKDAEEFLDTAQQINLAEHYSQFINYPIYVEHMVDVSVPIEDEQDVNEDIDKENDNVEDNDDNNKIKVDEVDDDTVDKKKEPKYRTEKKLEKKRVNELKAIWTRPPSEIAQDEYNEFFKSLSKINSEPLYTIHFSTEGDIGFRTILYIPKVADSELYTTEGNMRGKQRLYVRRVQITDDFTDMLPKYLHFLHGVIDSDDLPQNVNREMLAQNRVMKLVIKKITRKVLDTQAKSVQEDVELDESDDTTNDEINTDDDTNVDKATKTNSTKNNRYKDFWEQYQRSIKIGQMEDRQNSDQLTRQLRFSSYKHPEKQISFDEYVEEMPEDQNFIQYLTGENQETQKESPFQKAPKKYNYDVQQMDHPQDEYMISKITEYEEFRQKSVSKSDFSLGKNKENQLKKQANDYSTLITTIKEIQKNDVYDVRLTERLPGVAMAVSTSPYGQTANMERLLRSQALSDTKNTQYKASKQLELNPFHPIVIELQRLQVEEGKSKITTSVQLQYQDALIRSGFPQQLDVISEKISNFIQETLNVGDKEEVTPEQDISDEELEIALKPESQSSFASDLLESDTDLDNMKDEL